MEHGRDHDERLQKSEHPRNQNIPRDESLDTDLEAELLLSGRTDVRPGEGLVGAHFRRAEHTSDGALEDGAPPPSDGSDYAPTAQATRREAERHRLEREIGRIAAGTNGLERDSRSPDVTREDLKNAARDADLLVAGHEVPRQPREKTVATKKGTITTRNMKPPTRH